MAKKSKKLAITGREADFLLFAMDSYVGVDKKGRVLASKHGFTRKALTELRWKLFAAHEHAPNTKVY